MKKGIIRATFIVTLLTIANKIFGFLREAILASKIGISQQTDAFFLAQNMPSLLFPSVCMALSTSFLSMYIDKKNKEGELKSDRFASSAMLTNIFIALSLCIFSIVLAPIMVNILAPGFSSEIKYLSVKLTRLVMLSLPFFMIQYMCNSILVSKELYVGNQLAGFTYNIIIIASIYVLSDRLNVKYLTIIYISANIFQAMFLFILMSKKNKLKKPEKLLNKDVLRMLKLALPILVGNSIMQLNEIVDKIVASNLDSGSISALTYTNTLNNCVITIIISSLITVFYPIIIDCITKDDYKMLNKNIKISITFIRIVLIPITVITFLYSYDIVHIVYCRGEFNQSAVSITSSALKYYAISYVFIGLREIYVKVFYSYKDMKTPMINSIISVGINIVFSILLSRYYGLRGIALGTTIANIVSSILLRILIKKKYNYIDVFFFNKNFLKIAIANILSTILILVICPYLLNINILLKFMIITITYFLVYGIILFVLKCDETKFILSILKSKFNLHKNLN